METIVLADGGLLLDDPAFLPVDSLIGFFSNCGTVATGNKSPPFWPHAAARPPRTATPV